MSEFKKGDELWHFDESVRAFVKVRLLNSDQHYWRCESVIMDRWKNSDDEIEREAHADVAIDHVHDGLLHSNINDCLVEQLKAMDYRHHLEIGALYNARDRAVKTGKGAIDEG
jgi:hypothetical protein